MRSFLSVFLSLVLLGAVATAQSTLPHGHGVPMKKDRNRIKMDPSADSSDSAGKKTDSNAKAATPKPEKPVDPVQAAIKALESWPSAKAREAATTLILKGASVEDALIKVLPGASPALTSGICFVMGEIGGDKAVKVVETVAERPSMSAHLSVVFDALGKLTGLNAAHRVLRFLGRPQRSARLAAEVWLRSHLDPSLVKPLTALLFSSASGTRLSAFRLLGRLDAKGAEEHAFSLLADPSPELARTAANFLSGVGDDKAIARLNDVLAKGDSDRAAAYAAIALALVHDRTGGLPYTPAAVTALLGNRGIASPDKLNRGAAAVALADIGFASANPAVDAVLDQQVVGVLLDTFGGATFFDDYSSVAELARDRFGHLTGILDRRPIPELWHWWRKNCKGFVARRSLVAIDPATLKAFRIRVRSRVHPVVATTLFSTVPADAGNPENLGHDFVYLAPDEARTLAVLVTQKLLPLPDSGVVDPFRRSGDGSATDVGPEVVLRVSVGTRSRVIAGRAGRVPPALAEVMARLVRLAKRYSWQRYWDRATYPSFADFVRVEGAWFEAGHPAAAVAARMKGLIIGSLDDLVTADERTRALDTLEHLDVTFTDSDAYTLSLLLEHETGVTPFAKGLVSILAHSGRPLVLPMLSDWLEKHPNPKRLDLLADALTAMGEKTVLASAKSKRVLLARAAMRAAPAVLTGDELMSTLEGGLSGTASEVRREALISLGRTHRAEALPILTAALTGKNTADRNAAIQALGALGLPKAVPVLTKQLATGDFGSRVAAVSALCQSGLPAALGPVLAMIRKDDSPAVQSVAVQEVVNFGAKALPGLTAIATDGSEKPGVRSRSVGALVAVGGDQAAPVLAALLDDPAPDVADAAAFALATLQKKEAVPHLLSTLAKGSESLRTVASLEQVTCRAFPDAKAEELPSIYRGWWGKHKDESAADWFRQALAAEGYAVTDLVTLDSSKPDQRVVPVLISVLLDSNWYLRADANLWLGRVTARSFGDVTRFTSKEEVRTVWSKWKAWWKGR